MENRTVPAVHPRYRAFYTDLYEKEQLQKNRTIGIRLSLAAAIFAITILMSRNEPSHFSQMVSAIENNDEWIVQTLDWFDTLGHNWYNNRSD